MDKAELIDAELLARLAKIRKSNGYETDAGSKVLHGGGQAPEGKDSVTLRETEETTWGHNPRSTTCMVRPTYIIEGHAVCTAETHMARARALVRDICKAVELLDDPMLEQIWPVDATGVKAALIADRLQYAGKEIDDRAEGQNTATVRVKFNLTYQRD